MYKIITAITCLAILAIQTQAFAKINVVTTTSDLGYLTEQIGKDLVSVKHLGRGDQDTHFLEPKPSYIVATNQADLLIQNGMDLEIGWLPVLLSQAKNPKIQNNQPGNLVASNGIQAIEIPAGPIDRSHGDVHPLGNPHYLLNPHNVLTVATSIANRLKEIDPSNTAQYETNLNNYLTNLREKIKNWEKSASSLKGMQVITYHKTFNYLTNWLGIKVVNYLEPKPGLPPTASHLISLVNAIKESRLKLIITEIYHQPKPGRELASKTGIKAVEWPTSVGGLAETDTYEKLIDFLIKGLKENL